MGSAVVRGCVIVGVVVRDVIGLIVRDCSPDPSCIGLTGCVCVRKRGVSESGVCECAGASVSESGVCECAGASVYAQCV